MDDLNWLSLVVICCGFLGKFGPLVALIIWAHVLWLKSVDEGDGVKFLACILIVPPSPALREVEPQ